MDRNKIIEARIKQITELPLGDRIAIPHKYFMELTNEFLDLSREQKTLTASDPEK